MRPILPRGPLWTPPSDHLSYRTLALAPYVVRAPQGPLSHKFRDEADGPLLADLRHSNSPKDWTRYGPWILRKAVIENAATLGNKVPDRTFGARRLQRDWK